MIEVDEKEVASVVREHLRDKHPDGITLDVDEQGICKIDYWWRVPVRPDRQPEHPFAYYDALALAEGEIQDERDLNIVLVPDLRDSP